MQHQLCCELEALLVVGICISQSEKIKRDFQDDQYKDVLERLNRASKSEVHGVVLFVNEDMVKKVFANRLEYFC